jgi:hypothetical protein
MLDPGDREIDYTLRCSTILVSEGEELDVFHSLEELPDPVRRRVLEQSRRGGTATIFIANRGGREELTKRLRGLPSRVRTRLENSASVAEQAPAKRRPKPSAAPVRVPRFAMLPGGWPGAAWARQAFLLVAGAGALWAILSIR